MYHDAVQEHEADLFAFPTADAGLDSFETINPALLETRIGVSCLQSCYSDERQPGCGDPSTDVHDAEWDAFSDLPCATAIEYFASDSMAEAGDLSTAESSFSTSQSDYSSINLSSEADADPCCVSALPYGAPQSDTGDALKVLSQTLSRSCERLEALLERAVKCIERSTPCQYPAPPRKSSIIFDEQQYPLCPPQATATSDASTLAPNTHASARIDVPHNTSEAHSHIFRFVEPIEMQRESLATQEHELHLLYNLPDLQEQHNYFARNDEHDFMRLDSDSHAHSSFSAQSMASTALSFEGSFASFSSTPSSASNSVDDFRIRKRRKRQPKIAGYYTCVDAFCGKAFNTAGELNKHEKVHAPRDQHPYRCQKCGKTFIYPKDLRRHLATASHSQ